MQIERAAAGKADPSQVLTKALLRAAEFMALTKQDLADILGVSVSYISKLRSGASVLEPGTKTSELSLLLLRAFRSLDAIVGGNQETLRQWLRNEKTVLVGVPLAKMKSVEGLVTTVGYLDQRRAPL